MPATHNIAVAEEYEGRDGPKTKWNTIGVLIETEKDGKTRRSIKLNTIPLQWDGFASIFKIDRDRDGQGRQDNRRDAEPADQTTASNDINQGQHTNDTLNQDVGDEPIDLSDIPF